MCHGCKSKKTTYNPNLWKPIPAKVILLGSSQSGKTSLMLQYVCGVFHQPEDKWIYQAGSMKKLWITQGRSVKFEVWDSAGEKIENSSLTYLQDADAVLICFSVGDQASFEAAKHYLDMARIESPHDAHIIIVGNKCDLKEDADGDKKRKVRYEEAEDFALTHGLRYVEVSAKGKINVNETFERIANRMIERVDAEYEKEQEEKEPKKDDSYCSMF